MIKAGKIILILIFLFGVLFSIGKSRRHQKQIAIEQLIKALENYKTLHSSYPFHPDSTNIKVEDWIYYTSDSAGNYFNLSYSQGWMQMNTVRYDSRTNKWERIFNY